MNTQISQEQTRSLKNRKTLELIKVTSTNGAVSACNPEGGPTCRPEGGPCSPGCDPQVCGPYID